MIRKNYAVRACALAAIVMAFAASSIPQAKALTPKFGASVQAGTLGLGVGLDMGVSKYFGVQVGYAGSPTLHHSLNTSDVNYAGSLRLRTFELLGNWYAFGGGFHLTAGMVHNSTALDVVGQPQYGDYTLGGQTYTPSQLGSLSGKVRFANSTAPYIGIGWGNPTGKRGLFGSRVHLLFDIGAIYTGSPKASLSASCGPAAPAGSAMCSSIHSAVAIEQQTLDHKVDIAKWYPVINLGIAVRF